MTLSARAPLCIGLAVIGLWGCNPAASPSTPTTTSTPDSTPDSTASAPQPPTADSTNVEKNQYSGPPVTLDVLQLESHPVQHVAEVTVTVPTGGWTINLDKAEIKGGVAEVYLTLEGPGADEMVTQAQETLQVRHASTVPPFTSARVWVHLARRDIQTLTTNYRLAAP